MKKKAKTKPKTKTTPKVSPAKKAKSRPDNNGRIRSTFTGTRTFDRSLHKTNAWLKDIMELMEWQNRERALTALKVTLQSLRDLLPVSEVVHLGAQLPILIRGLYYDGWKFNADPLRLKNISEFYDLIRWHLGRASAKFSADEIKEFTGAALETLTKHIDIGEARDIKVLLRKKLRELIPVSLDKTMPASRNPRARSQEVHLG
jgi:uncharacterized protein (DUF2267 family)